MRVFYEKHKQVIDKAALVCGLLVLVYVFVNYLFTLVAPFLVGYLLAAIMEPLARLLTGRLKLPRWLSSIICILLLLFVVGGIGVSAVVKLLDEARSFAQYAPTLIKDTSGALQNLGDRFADLVRLVPASVQNVASDALASTLSAMTSALGDGVKNVSLRFVSNIPDGLVSFILTFVSCYFFISDRRKIHDAVRERVPRKLMDRLGLIRTGVIKALGGYFRAEFILMSIIACEVIIGLLVLRNQYALFLGLLIAFIDALPILGGGLILWPWALYSFVYGDYGMAAGLLIIYGVMFVTRHTLEPRILGGQIGVHPLPTLMSMYVGLKLFGFWGLIIGPATLIIIKAATTPEDKDIIKPLERARPPKGRLRRRKDNRN